MGRKRWWRGESCVGCQILSILHIALCLCVSVSIPLHPHLCPPPIPPPAQPPHHISLRFPPYPSITLWTGSQAPCLENKLIFTHHPPFSRSSLLRTPPQKTPLVHLRPSIAHRRYSCSLLIIFLCGQRVIQTRRKQDWYREGDLSSQCGNVHTHLQKRRLFTSTNLHTKQTDIHIATLCSVDGLW